MSASESVQSLTSALKGMKLEASEAISVVDKLTKLDAISATSAKNLADALSKVANSARLAKVSEDEILGLLSTGIEVTQQSGDVIGTALRSMLARFSNVKAGKFAEGDEEGSINDTEKVLKKLGINIRSGTNELRSFMDVLDDVAAKWESLDDISRNAIVTALGGTRQKEVLSSLLENWARVKELTEESANSAGTADKKYEAYMDSMEAATKRLQNAWEGFTQGVEGSTVLKTLTNWTSFLVENLDRIVKLTTVFLSAKYSGKINQFFGNTWKGIEKFFQSSPLMIDDKNQVTGGKTWLQKLTGRGDTVQTKTLSVNQQQLDVQKQILQKVIGSQKTLGTGGTPVGKGSDGKYYYLNKDGSLSKKAVSAKKQEALEKATQKSGLTANIGMGVTTAALSLITSLGTSKQVGGGISSVLGINKTGQAIDETSGGKALRAVATAGLAGVGAAFLGPVGAMLGQTIGEGVSNIISTIVHRDELEMKQRVQEAKENLEALNKINGTIETNNDLMSKEVITSDDQEALQEYADTLYENLSGLSSGLKQDFLNNVKDGMSEALGENNELSNISTISELCEKITSINSETRDALQKQLNLETAKANYQQLIASQEEERKEISNIQISDEVAINEVFKALMLGGNKKIAAEAQEKAIEEGWVVKLKDEDQWQQYKYAAAGDTLEQRYENAQKVLQLMKDTDEEAKYVNIGLWEKYVQSLGEMLDKNSKLNKELREAQINVGLAAVDVSDLTDKQLKAFGQEGVFQEVINAMEEQGFSVRDAAGYIKNEYIDQINSAIKADSRFTAALNKESKTYKELQRSQRIFEASTADLGKTYYELLDLLETGKFDKWAEGLGKNASEIQKLKEAIYSYNPQDITDLAHAFGYTAEKFEDFVNNLGISGQLLSTNLALMSSSELSDYFSKYSDFFDDLADDSELSAENLEKIIKEYPQLLDYVGDSDELTEAMISQLYGENGLKNVLMDKSIKEAFYSSEYVLDQFLNQYTGDKNIFGNSETFNDIISLISSGKISDEKVIKAIEDYLSSQKYTYTVEDEALNKAIEYQTNLLDEQINSLNEQKDALSKVNDERQKELDLIKAKDALENAKKEKVAVYRSGVGFVYEANEQAIKEAQENLDKLNTEKQQDTIQMQIDVLQKQKDILDNLESNKAKEALEEFSDYVTSENGALGAVGALAEAFNNLEKRTVDMFKTGASEGSDNIQDAIDVDRETRENLVSNMKNTGSIAYAKSKVEEFRDAMNQAGISDANKRKAQEAYNTWVNKYSSRVKNYISTYGEKPEGYSEYTYNTIEKSDLAMYSMDATQWNYDRVPDGNSIGETDKAVFTNHPYSETELKDDFNDASDMYKRYPSDRDLENGQPYYNNSKWEKHDSTDFSGLPDYTLIGNIDGEDWFGYVLNGKLYKLAKNNASNNGHFATGTYSSPEGPSLINELGTEAIITPEGTVTALPSKTGIVPADITKNLWSLGEIAPTLIARLGSLSQGPIIPNTTNTTYEEGQYIDNLNMTIYPTKDYDMDKLLAEVRAKAKITRHNG